MAGAVMSPALLLLAAYALSSSTGKPRVGRVVVLAAGKVCRLKFKIWNATPPMGRAFADGVKEGLELAGMLDIRVTYGPTPTFEYTQKTASEVTIVVGERKMLQLNGARVTLEFLWAREIGDVPNV